MEQKHLRCDANHNCKNPVSYIDNKGFIYCVIHGTSRQFYRPCRKLRPHELNRLKKGETIKRY